MRDDKYTRTNITLIHCGHSVGVRQISEEIKGQRDKNFKFIV